MKQSFTIIPAQPENELLSLNSDGFLREQIIAWAFDGDGGPFPVTAAGVTTVLSFYCVIKQTDDTVFDGQTYYASEMAWKLAVIKMKRGK